MFCLKKIMPVMVAFFVFGMSLWAADIHRAEWQGNLEEVQADLCGRQTSPGSGGLSGNVDDCQSRQRIFFMIFPTMEGRSG